MDNFEEIEELEVLGMDDISKDQKKEQAINILNAASDLIGFEKFKIVFEDFKDDNVIEYKSLENKICINNDILDINIEELQLGILVNFFSQFYFEKELAGDIDLEQLSLAYNHAINKATAYAIYILSFLYKYDYYELFKEQDDGDIKDQLIQFKNQENKMKVIAILKENNLNSKIIDNFLKKQQENKNIN